MKKLILLLWSALLFSTCASQDKNSIYEFRNSGRTGIYQESNLLKTWPAEGPKEIMVVENIGNGYVSPVFTNDGFFISGEIDSMCILFSFNLNGEKQWQTTLGKEWLMQYPGSRCTPTIVGDLVYAGTGFGNLYCLNRKNGKIVWSKDLAKDFNGVLPMHGYSEAPLIEGDKVFWTPGGKLYNVVALNRFNGNLIWSNKGFGEASGYNPGKLIILPARNILVTFSMYHMMGFDTKTGQLLWSHEQTNYPVEKRGPGYGDTHSNAVIYENGVIWYVEGDGNCSVRLNMSPDGSKITEAWRNKGFDSFMGGVVKSGNYLYCGAVAKPQLVSLDATTGQLVDSLKTASGAIIMADNMLYYYNQKGELMLLSFNQGKMQMVSSFRVKKGTLQHFSHPVINNGVLWQRHGKVLMAYDIRNK
ncbi:MAG: PQQ-like beta-propeller repeat protein [Bacteroidales bacterium]|jgi:outer membrane protein assembly factor BamB|nr:PQQ-like beta-propeller repeat protein [Bacteroidales bacterium]